MNDALLAEVERRLTGQPIAPAVAEWVLTACLEPEDLGDTPSRPPRPGPPGNRPTVADQARVFLASVSVEGFRGIGPPLTLPLTPGPGLCLVVGANGTGKSSVSDALEVLLTGDSARWTSKKAKTWQDGWRNLHHTQTEIQARLVVEGMPGYATVTRRWDAGGNLASGTVTVIRPGRPAGGFDSLGWQDALVSFRPFLSYSELGGLLEDGPSKLFDALNAILGLEDLSAAAKALAGARLDIEHRARQAATELDRFRELLDGSQDERAVALRAAAAAKVPDLDAIGDRIEPTSTAPPEGGELDLLRRLAQIELPTEADIEAGCGQLTAAAAHTDALAATDAGRARAVADLLDAAVEFHRHHGDGDCPVCGRVGGLSSDWRTAADAERARLRTLAAEADDAHRSLDQAITRARAFIPSPPEALADAGQVGIDATAVQSAWQAWARTPQDTPLALAEHLSTVNQWRAEVVAVRAAAEQLLASRQDGWRPLAEAGMAWLDHARAARADASKVKDLKAAEAWLKTTESEIRAERFAPLATAATKVWQMLRQRSSVDIGGITLTGSATSRRVTVDVSVDGCQGAALAVMSQGELHALALALFFPRAMLADSPFRFIVIDDPVQAMDPAKVEGLARVLEEAAATHQVVVLTHDDRLPEAVRRLRIGATIIEVSRGPGSEVVVAKVLDPVDRHLRDAHDVAVAKELPDEVKARVIPALCRQALEATCVEIARRRRLGRGDRHENVQKVIGLANKLTKSMALAMFDDVDKGGNVLPKLLEWDRRMAQTYQDCNRGSHGAYVGDPEDLVRDTRALVKKLGTLS